jgi:hypothetical protein
MLTKSVVALSTLEVEHIACSDATRKAIWLKRLLAEITKTPEDDLGSTPIGCDIQGAVKLIESEVVKAKASILPSRIIIPMMNIKKGLSMFTMYHLRTTLLICSQNHFLSRSMKGLRSYWD